MEPTAILNQTAPLHVGILGTILNHQGVAAAVQKQLAAGVSFAQILQALLPFVLQLLSGQPLNWAAIIAAIEALIVPTPAK